MIRTFISIDLPEGMKEGISGLQGRLRSRGGHIGWVRPEAIHLTLKFLGEIDEKEIPDIETAIRRVTKDFVPFYLRTMGLGLFPSIKKPRIIWLGINGEGDNLLRLQSRIEEEMEKIGHPREKRGFKPHLTIGRVRDPSGLKGLIDAIQSEREIELGGFKAEEVLIMRSDMRPEGSIYTRLFEIKFD